MRECSEIQITQMYHRVQSFLNTGHITECAYDIASFGLSP